MEHGSCENCDYCEQVNDDRFCHRNPPQVVVIGQYSVTLRNTWPEVGPNDWCGEFSDKRKRRELAVEAFYAHEI